MSDTASYSEPPDALAKELGYRSTTRFRVRNLILSLTSAFGSLTSDVPPSVTLLVLHHVFSDEESLFQGFVQYLARSFTFVSYSDAIKRIQHGPIDRAYICFSFDDGLRSSLRAAQILEEFGARACFFIVPSFVGADVIKARELSSYLNLPPAHFLNQWDIECLLHRGHEIGGHSLTHPNLATCSQEKLQEEIFECYARLQKWFTGSAHFAWPYGRWDSFTYEARRYVEQAGFISSASAISGSYTVPFPNAAAYVRRCSLRAFEGLRVNCGLIYQALSHPVTDRPIEGLAVAPCLAQNGARIYALPSHKAPDKCGEMKQPMTDRR